MFVTALHDTAPAKINLALHILKRREDGFHELESLVAFEFIGDHLALTPADELSLRIKGPAAHALPTDDSNLIIKAVRALLARKPELRTGEFFLEKHLPVASGIGGGSADAAAALRLVARLNDLPLSDPDILAAARETGADVPVCLESRARIMRGIGEVLGPPLDLPQIAALLINPGIGLPTPAVFQKLGLARGQNVRSAPIPALPPQPTQADLIDLLRHCRNDLEAAAIALEPSVETLLNLIRATPSCLMARMSGSGATVFGLYPDIETAEDAMNRLAKDHPNWWMCATWLR